MDKTTETNLVVNATMGRISTYGANFLIWTASVTLVIASVTMIRVGRTYVHTQDTLVEMAEGMVHSDAPLTESAPRPRSRVR